MYLTKDYLHLYQLKDCIVPMTGCWSSIRACMLHYAAWLLCHTTSHVTRGTLHGTHYTLHGAHYTLHGTRYMSRDARYTIHTIRRAMHRRQCHVTGHVVNPNTKPCNFSPDSSYSHHRGKRIVPSMVKCYWYRHIAAVCRLPGTLIATGGYLLISGACEARQQTCGGAQLPVCSNAVQVQCCPLPPPPPPLKYLQSLFITQHHYTIHHYLSLFPLSRLRARNESALPRLC